MRVWAKRGKDRAAELTGPASKRCKGAGRTKGKSSLPISAGVTL